MASKADQIWSIAKPLSKLCAETEVAILEGVFEPQISLGGSKR